MLGEPNRTPADLHFRVFGFPVRVHPLFWLLALLLGAQAYEGDPAKTLIWIGVVFVSILVHELGHAFLIRSLGEQCWITLWAFGGLASAAGPAAGFLLAVVVILGVMLSGHTAGVTFDANRLDLSALGVGSIRYLDVIFFDIYFEPFANDKLNALIHSLLFVNIFWGLLNLLPVYPLDGGQISRELFVQHNYAQGIRQSLMLSIGTAVALAVFGLFYFQSFFMALMFGFLAYNNYVTLQNYQGRSGPYGW